MEPYQRLAMEVIKSAVQDLNLANKRIKRLSKKLGNEENLKRADVDRNEIIKFFNNEEWCGFWCDIAGINYDALMDRVRELIG